MEPDQVHSVVLETLARAASQQVQVLTPAQQSLQHWEVVPGFYSVLKNIFSNPEIDQNIRLLAVLYTKNGVDRYWRKTAPNAISQEERTGIKQSLIADFSEPDNLVALQKAVLISKISRYDWPGEWEELLPTLVEATKSEDGLVRYRSVLVLYHVIKTLASKRLAGHRYTFQQLAAYVLPYVASLWNNYLQLFVVRVREGDAAEARKSLELALLASKMLEKLVIHGFRNPHESSDVSNYFKQLFPNIRMLLQARREVGALEELLSRTVYRLMSTLLAYLEHHPFSFVQLVPTSLELAWSYAFTAEGEPFLFERFLIQCLNLVKAILLCPEYRSGGRGGGGSGSGGSGSGGNRARRLGLRRSPASPAPAAPVSPEQVEQAKQEFFTKERVEAMCRRMILHYMPLSGEELSQWASDPETFANEECGESWKYSLRPCLESAWVGLFKEFSGELTPVLMGLVRAHEGELCEGADLAAILAKDAVYCALGLAGFEVFDEVDFNSWLQGSLGREMASPGSDMRIVRRRVAWLLGRWTAVNLGLDFHPLAFSLLLPRLDTAEDLVVRLTAAYTVEALIDVFGFNVDSFLPFLEPLFKSLLTLLKEAEECDTKMKVLHVLFYMVERVGTAIQPYYMTLFHYLPVLWAQADQHHMLRCAVLSILVPLVTVMGPVGEPGQTGQTAETEATEFILSVIHMSTDVSQDCHVYQLEDGIALWDTLARNYRAPTPALMALLNNLFPLVENCAEHMRSYLTLLKVYILLAPDQLLQMYGPKVVSTFGSLMTDMLSEGVVKVLRVFETMLRADSARAVPLLAPLLPNMFQTVCKSEELELTTMAITMFLLVLARVLLASRALWAQALDTLALSSGHSTDQILSKFMDVWLNHMPRVSQQEQSKLLALALSSLLTAQSRVLYDKFCGILLAVGEVICDISQTDEHGRREDSLLVSGETTEGGEGGEGCGGLSGEGGDNVLDDYPPARPLTEHARRKALLCLRDPEHTIGLEHYFVSQLQELKRAVGTGEFGQLVATVDVETLGLVREFAGPLLQT